MYNPRTVNHSKSSEGSLRRKTRREASQIRVVIGMLDPDKRIPGRRVQRLRDSDIRVDLFPNDLGPCRDRSAAHEAFSRWHRHIRLLPASAHPPTSARGRCAMSYTSTAMQSTSPIGSSLERLLWMYTSGAFEDQSVRSWFLCLQILTIRAEQIRVFPILLSDRLRIGY